MKKWKTLDSETLIQTKRFTIKKDKIQYPNGQTAVWEYEAADDAILTLGITAEKKVVVTRQYRYVIDEEVIEFPTGLIDKDESLESAAKREFEEESGYACQSVVLLGSFYESYGVSNRKIHLYFAQGVTKSEQNLDQGHHGYEDIHVELMEREEVLQMIKENKISGASAALAFFLAKEKGLI